MKVSAFTFLRNAVLNGFPFEESIKSVLPICDEYIAVIGQGQDETDRVRAIEDPKIQWRRSGTRKADYLHGQQKMTGMFQCTGDWVYLRDRSSTRMIFLHQEYGAVSR